MNKLFKFSDFKMNEILSERENLFEIELGSKYFDIYWDGQIYLNSKNEFKIGKKSDLSNDLHNLGIDPEYDYELDSGSCKLNLKYSWEISTQKFGISAIKFVPISATVEFIVLKIDSEGNEKEFEFEFEIKKFEGFQVDLKLPLSDISVELTANKDFKELDNPDSWKWEFEIGSRGDGY